MKQVMKKLQVNEVPSLMQAFTKKVPYQINNVEKYNDFEDWEVISNSTPNTSSDK